MLVVSVNLAAGLQCLVQTRGPRNGLTLTSLTYHIGPERQRPMSMPTQPHVPHVLQTGIKNSFHD